MPDAEFPDCMNCGYPVEECECGGCILCGGHSCEHLASDARFILSALGSALRNEGKTRPVNPKPVAPTLASCPFCGGQGSVVEFVQSPDCYGCLECEIWARDVESWNRREQANA